MEGDEVFELEGYVLYDYVFRNSFFFGLELLSYCLVIIVDGEYSQQCGGNFFFQVSVLVVLVVDVSVFNVIYEWDLVICLIFIEV